MLNVFIYESYRKLVFGDPGYVKETPEIILDMIEKVKVGIDVDKYCGTCIVIPPLCLYILFPFLLKNPKIF